MDTHTLPWLNECYTFVRDLGFPIFVAIWVLIVTQKQTRLLTEAINRLTTSFEKANIIINHVVKQKE
jgi:hypothetical protein